MQPKLKPPGTTRLKLKCDMLLLTAAFKFNLRRYTVRVNSQTANLLAFQVRVAFDADVFEATVGRCRLPV